MQGSAEQLRGLRILLVDDTAAIAKSPPPCWRMRVSWSSRRLMEKMRSITFRCGARILPARPHGHPDAGHERLRAATIVRSMEDPVISAYSHPAHHRGRVRGRPSEGLVRHGRAIAKPIEIDNSALGSGRRPAARVTHRLPACVTHPGMCGKGGVGHALHLCYIILTDIRSRRGDRHGEEAK